MESLNDLVQNLGVLVLVTAVVVEAFKRTNVLQTRFLPLFSLVVGVVAGVVIPGFGWVAGLLAGSVTSGLYDVVKKTLLGK